FLRQKCQTLQQIELRIVVKIEKSGKQGGKGPFATGLKSHSMAKGQVKNGNRYTYFCEKFLIL
ncbi:hypothetical protein ALC56_09147, partial [Trachymyrmex septentrionalis]